MVKYCIEKYPKGSFKGQQTDGKYMDGYLHENITLLARNIVKDVTFLGVMFSSTLEVGTGKSTIAQQVGEAYTEQVNKLHGLNLTFDEKNIVFRPEKLMEIAPNLPKYSCIVLDEWDEKTYFDKLALALRQFFRKCRQLNLFMIIIIPDFFQLPKGYAISRSVFAIDVKFSGEFDKGFFDFYNFDKKKELYIKGKKFYNYGVAYPNFKGRFPDGYAVPREVYEKIKRDDFVEADIVEVDTKTKMRDNIYVNLKKNFPDMMEKEIAGLLNIDNTLISKIKKRVANDLVVDN